ncbi:lytic murein transglycosylase [Spiribacter halobius]|uniref:Lytic murein transglycosylase n=1 Tax=Sediminicurvatus halobius TaxID=2182432 RepID=A0A2U2N911_9GAMM|nr:lytic murein transglycosylase [Spiribacter halobius]PWG65464.1 lytic murein transglycosylase [Spiribacter halobius]UEX76486.1 lytic murein transglycosylase [Spiribacter halobius]
MRIAPLVALALLLPGFSATAAQADFRACIGELQERAREQGLSEPVVTGLLGDVERLDRVIELDRQQPEFTASFGDYLNRRVTEARIREGREMLDRHRDLLQAVEREYAVPARYLVAIWGLETNYGSYTGDLSTLDALATLACDRRRGSYFGNELLAALTLVDRDAVTSDQLRGSWAGALGNFQFMPSVYERYAVDRDGDGRADLWNSIADAAASAARFLNALGWQYGERWGREVRLPDDFDYAAAERRRPVSAWAADGVRRADGGPLPDAALEGRIIVPAGHRGPAFLVYENFDVIMGWNPSRFYALAVGHLADRLVGAPSLHQPPPEEPPLRIDTLRTVQARLNERGYDSGEPDGRLGPATRSALRRFQEEEGLVADGHPGPSTLQALGVARR